MADARRLVAELAGRLEPLGGPDAGLIARARKFAAAPDRSADLALSAAALARGVRRKQNYLTMLFREVLEVERAALRVLNETRPAGTPFRTHLLDAVRDREERSRA